MKTDTVVLCCVVCDALCTRVVLRQQRLLLGGRVRPRSNDSSLSGACTAAEIECCRFVYLAYWLCPLYTPWPV